MNTVTGPAPGFRRHPEHRITIINAHAEWSVSQGRTVFANSEHARVLKETGYRDVVYFPAVDVRFETLTQSSSETSCPFKGRAAYFRSAADSNESDIAWTYSSTYDEVKQIEGFIAFYTDRVDIKENESA